MGIAAAAKQMGAFNDQLERARKEQEKILSNAKKLSALPGSGGIAGQQALQGGQLVGAGATALPGDPGGLRALLKSAFRAIAGGDTSIATTGGGGGAGVNATASSSRSAPGIRGATGPRFNVDDQGARAPFFAGFDPMIRLLTEIRDDGRSSRQQRLLEASTRSSR